MPRTKHRCAFITSDRQFLDLTGPTDFAPLMGIYIITLLKCCVAGIFRDRCIRAETPSYGGAPGDPIVSNGAQWLLSGSQLAPECLGWARGLGWGHWHFQRTQLAAGGLVCVSRKFATMTPYRRIRGPRGGPVTPHRCLGALIRL